jgi:hypothetical protein
VRINLSMILPSGALHENPFTDMEGANETYAD